MKRFLLLPLFLALFSQVIGQNIPSITNAEIASPHVSNPAFCKTDQVHAQLMMNDPEYAAIRQLYHQQMIDYMKGNYAPQRVLSGVVTIPVVVHVVHLGEAVGTGTNISDAQIQSAIANMNDAYSNASPYGNSVDLEIQFTLAKRDENCNSTTGIVRVDGTSVSGYSSNGITSSNETSVKALSKWNNSSYYNIWIVSEIDGNNGGSGTQGYAYFPGASSAKDGAVMLYNAFGYDPDGSIGYNLKSYTRDNSTVIHEMGHALDLYHTFEGDGGDSNLDNVGDNCPTNVDPSTDGDMISDTEPHKMHTSQCLSGQINDCTSAIYSDAVAKNFMSYSSCQDRFTSGQKTRMRSALEIQRPGLINSLGGTAISGSAPTASVTCTPATSDVSNGYGFGVYELTIGTTTTTSGGSVAEGGYATHWCNNYSVEENTQYAIEVVNGTLNNENVAVYIDYNNDGDFLDTGEEIFTSSNALTHSGNFTTPTGFSGEIVWVRVVSDYAANSISGPCYAPQYGQVEDFSVELVSAVCSEPDVPTLSHSGTICDGSSATVSITGALNDATQWVVYTGSCGGTQVTTTSSNSFSVTPSSPSTTYYVRGEGGCAASGSCGQITLNVTSLDDASFSYSGASYCVNDADPTPTVTGLGGGTFTSSPAGLSINASTGAIDVSASTPNTYTVTYTTGGTCPNSSNVNVTINALDDASFSYSASSYCVNDSDPTPTVTGLGGGTFTSSPVGLSINASTGAIDVSASTPNTYTVTYTTAGSCPNSSNVNVTINTLDDASFSYSATSYCVSDADPTPTVTGLGGGTFTSSPAGLSINASTGAIDVSASTPNIYTVTYTTAGTCPNSSNVNVTINALDDASFSYSASTYCITGSDPTPTVTGLGGGTFTSVPVGLSINASTGAIDVSASVVNTYTVTYTTAGSCPNSSNVNVTINLQDDASFSYGAASYCMNDSDPTPTITGTTGGTFSSSPAGLSINTSTGAIDVSASTANTYTVTYTTGGSCSNSSNVNVTINAIDDASFSYGASAYCVDGSDPTPTVTGLGGGTFTSSPAGLSINASTGAIDVSASTPNTYTVTYTTAGTCPNSSNVNVTINALDDASFHYSGANYCSAGNDPTPTIDGLAGGSFSSTAGLSINSSNGAIDLSASTLGTYTVTYLTSGTCANSSNVNVTVNQSTDASFSYSAASYCSTDGDPTPSVTGDLGGTFSSTAGLVLNSSTGVIDLSASTPGSYNVTYQVSGACPSQSSVAVDIQNCINVPDTKLMNQYCGITVSSFGTKLFAEPVSGASQYEFEFTPQGGGSVITKIRGTYNVTLTQAGISALGQVYDVRVRAYVSGQAGNYSTICQVTTPSTVPTTKLKSAYCGITVNALNKILYAYPVSGATKYEFEFTPHAGGTPVTKINNGYIVTFVQAGINTINETYDVRVRAYINGQPGNYGAVCQVSTPSSVPTTKLRTQDCGRVLTSYGTTLFANTVYGADQYEFEVTPQGGGTPITIIRNAGNFTISQLGLYTPNQVYDVRVRAYMGADIGAYGPVCQVTSPSTTALATNDQPQEVLDQVRIGAFANEEMVESSGIEEDIFEGTTAYPNPFKDNLNLDFGSNVMEKEIRIYNSVGQLMETIITSESFLELNLGEMNPGVYIMQVVSEGQMKTIRLVKN